ncbi:MAG: hypothetical protein K6E40_13360 [Desulfovibrio sp.]|nr:hypothetical protein [Desulfovibrio sp.]
MASICAEATLLMIAFMAFADAASKTHECLFDDMLEPSNWYLAGMLSKTFDDACGLVVTSGMLRLPFFWLGFFLDIAVFGFLELVLNWREHRIAWTVMLLLAVPVGCNTLSNPPLKHFERERALALQRAENARRWESNSDEDLLRLVEYARRPLGRV